MSTAKVGMVGSPPTVLVSNFPPDGGQTKQSNVVPLNAPRPSEKEIYTKMWANPIYRQVAPGEGAASHFLAQAKPRPGATVIDFGCGTGRGSLNLALLGQMDVTMVDFATNCLDEDIYPMLDTQAHTMRFVEADITDRLPISLVAQYGFCTDVMEHIPPHLVDNVLNNILKCCKHVYFQIATKPDVHGREIGHPLHLTVQPYEWWMEKFKDRECVIHWSDSNEHGCGFYLTAWATGQKVSDAGIINTQDEQIRKNVEVNIKRGIMQVAPHQTNDLEVMILGGGPTLNDHLEEIRQKRKEGVKLICLNATYEWALDNDLHPSALVMVDARPFNARFAKRVTDDCKYFIASQCDPSVFEGLPPERTLIWHTSADLIKDLLEAEYGKLWWSIPGGCTVLTRSLFLFRALGFKKYHLYGCDSCVMPMWRLKKSNGEFATKIGSDEFYEFVSELGAKAMAATLENEHAMPGYVPVEYYKHHAYPQKENDGDGVAVTHVTPSNRMFYCNTWQVAQANDFLEVIKGFGDEIDVAVYGDGLLAHILNTGAELADNEVLT